MLKILLNSNLERILMKRSPGSVSLEVCHPSNHRPQVLPLFHPLLLLWLKTKQQCPLWLVFALFFILVPTEQEVLWKNPRIIYWVTLLKKEDRCSETGQRGENSSMCVYTSLHVCENMCMCVTYVKVWTLGNLDHFSAKLLCLDKLAKTNRSNALFIE